MAIPEELLAREFLGEFWCRPDFVGGTHIDTLLHCTVAGELGGGEFRASSFKTDEGEIAVPIQSDPNLLARVLNAHYKSTTASKRGPYCPRWSPQTPKLQVPNSAFFPFPHCFRSLLPLLPSVDPRAAQPPTKAPSP
jgi:hypothetical protein